jgi:DNA topoisomerase-1
MVLLVSLPKGENPLDVDYKRAQELIDEKPSRCTYIVYKGEER